MLPGAQISPGTETKAGPITPGKKSTKLLPFDSLLEEYIPQPAPIYDRNYAARPVRPVATPLQTPEVEQDKTSSTASVNYPDDVPAPRTFAERFFPIDTKRSLMLEVILSLFTGIFGVGWLLIGKKRTGIFLLVTSLIFFAPLLIVSYALAYSSYGISILCTGPFIVGAVALNAFILHTTMQRIRILRAL